MNWNGGLADVRLAVICGPTAAGKSALAVALAEAVGAAIVTADSRQLYRGFDIGTGKATPSERARVPHFGIDVAEPTERYSAARWAQQAATWIASSRALGRAQLIVGGTGFYLRALASPLFDEPELDPARRFALERLIEHLPDEERRRWCAVLDPDRARLGPRQLMRALTVALMTGRRITEMQASASRASAVPLRYLVVDPGPLLADRIAARVDSMLEAGWEREVRRLCGTAPANAPAWNASGYRLMRRVVDGTLTLAEARDAIIIETRQYAKRQRTWFRHQLPDALVTRVNPDEPTTMRRATAWWHGASPDANTGDA